MILLITATYTKVVSLNSYTDATIGSNFNVDYAVFSSPHQAAGTYTGKVKFTLVHPESELAPIAPLAESACPANSICYAPNANDIIGSMDSISEVKISTSSTAGVQSVSANGTPTLIAPNYSRNEYGFAGWSTDFEATNSSKIYGPNQTVITKTDGTGDADVSSHGLILYPVWIENEDYLQDWDGCGNLESASYTNSVLSADLDSVTALKDKRDGKVYAVARLSDGNCWLIENLRLGNVSADLMAAWSQGIGGGFTTLADSENSNFGNTTAANSLYSTGSAVTMPRYNGNNSNRNLQPRYTLGKNGDDYYAWYGYGHYYTWEAAKANTLSFSDYNSSTAAETSLCPKGWVSPRGTQAGEYYSLINSMSGNTGQQGARELLSFPNNFVLAGSFSNSTASAGTYGYLWTSSKYKSMTAYMVQFHSSAIASTGTGSYDPYSGRPIRCTTSPVTE